MDSLTNITGDPSTFVPALPAQQVTVGSVPPLNPNFVGSFTMSNEVIRLQRGTAQACITLPDIRAALILIVPALTYPPVFTLQPVSATVVATNPALFTVVASGENDTAYPVTYQWIVSIDQGDNYTNVTNGGAYSGATTANLTVTPPTPTVGPPPVNFNGYIYACIATNTPGSTNSTGAILTVT